MKRFVLVMLAMCLVLPGCSAAQNPAKTEMPTVSGELVDGENSIEITPLSTGEKTLPDALLESYYLSPEDPVFSYLQNNSIRRFMSMWLEYDLDEKLEVQWNYDTLAPVRILDHSLESIARPGTDLYTCTFTTGDGRCGYIIVSYGEDGPHISKWSLHETTPYQYDLRANSEGIAAALAKTDMDLATATATRVEWIDTDKNRGDRVILFADGKGDHYICYLGDDDVTLEKQPRIQSSTAM